MITITGIIGGIKHQRVFGDVDSAREGMQKLLQRKNITNVSYKTI